MDFTFERNINYYETDKMGVVHHTNYIRFLEDNNFSNLSLNSFLYFFKLIGFKFLSVKQCFVSPINTILPVFFSVTSYPTKKIMESIIIPIYV